MISLDLDLREFQRKAREMQAAQDQVRFALSQALNEAAKNTRAVLINETWPRFVQVRNRNFIRNALRVQFASKRALSVTITNEGTSAGNRGHLALHAKGGTKRAKGRLAIPSRAILGNRSGKGMPARLRPATAPNTVLIGSSIFQRQGRALRLLYSLKPSATIKADVPFHREFVENMRREVRGQFGLAMRRAMATRR